MKLQMSDYMDTPPEVKLPIGRVLLEVDSAEDTESKAGNPVTLIKLSAVEFPEAPSVFHRITMPPDGENPKPEATAAKEAWDKYKTTNFLRRQLMDFMASMQVVDAKGNEVTLLAAEGGNVDTSTWAGARGYANLSYAPNKTDPNKPYTNLEFVKAS